MFGLGGRLNDSYDILFMFKLWAVFVDGGAGDMKLCMRKTIHELFVIKSVSVTWFLR